RRPVKGAHIQLRSLTRSAAAQRQTLDRATRRRRNGYRMRWSSSRCEHEHRMVACNYSCMATPRIARAPHTSKVPDVCPQCGGRSVSRRGTRKKKFEIVQLWKCASCKRTFTPAPDALRNKTYPLRVILDALTTYSLGYSHEETRRHIKAKTGRTISDSTLS